MGDNNKRRMDKIAVILPVYKNDKVPYIKLSFDSILNQTYKSFHLYVGVDGPVGEDLASCLKEYEKDARVTIEWFKENRGLAGYWQNGQVIFEKV